MHGVAHDVRCGLPAIVWFNSSGILSGCWVYIVSLHVVHSDARG
jgi:hypothetical protein